MTISELILDRIRSAPDRPWLTGPDGELSYRDLDEITAGIAGRLAEHGVVPGEIVAIDVPPSTLGACLPLAVWRAGAAFLLFDPVQPELRRRELMADAGVRLRLGVRDSEVTIETVGERTIWEPEDLAYVVYTSGSTGAPKGVLCRHSSLPPLVEMAAEGFGITENDRMVMLMPFHVEGVVFHLAVPLLLGASLHLPGQQDRDSVPELTKFLREKEISVLICTPTRLVDLDPLRFPSLRTVVSAGEDLTPELARRWADGRRLINSYGVTEGTIASTLAVIPPDVSRVPIGRPIAHNTVRLLDERRRPVAPGEPGEVYLGGAGVAAGYLNRPELTAERFVKVDGERMYRTGDFAEADETGLLYFAGRRDDQVQLGGFRVEPGEVRAVLHGHPAVHDCVVVARDARLVAYVVSRGEPASPAALRDWLAERMPSYQVPSRYVLVADLPRTAWGKVDLRALPEPGPALSGDAGPAPATASVRAALAAAVGELLGETAVGADQLDEDLFLLGLTSILVSKLILRVDEEFGVRLSPVDVFEHPTVGELAGLVEQAIAAR